MNYDIGDLLNGWEFNPDEFLARRIRTSKGDEKLQIRIDMGVLQLELNGRPDGKTPHDCPSLLEYYQNLIETRDESEDLILDEEECEDLFQEAWQFYHRYLSLFYLSIFMKPCQHSLQTNQENTYWLFQLLVSLPMVPL